MNYSFIIDNSICTFDCNDFVCTVLFTYILPFPFIHRYSEIIHSIMQLPLNNRTPSIVKAGMLYNTSQ